MATLEYVKERKNDGLLLLGIDEEGESARYTVSSQTYIDIGSPVPKDTISETDMMAIKYSDRIMSATRKALSILACADNNRRTLMMKLLRAGYEREICEAVCSDMISLGYIDEKRQLERIITVEANQKLRGPGKIIPALSQKGFSASVIREVMSELVSRGEVDFALNSQKLILKKLGENPENDEEVKTILYKNGYKI